MVSVVAMSVPMVLVLRVLVAMPPAAVRITVVVTPTRIVGLLMKIWREHVDFDFVAHAKRAVSGTFAPTG